jgi:predicted DNA-binding protein (MmcQ/YjbR family)
VKAGREATILKKLRVICLALPGASETTTFGHPTFRAGGKTFAVLEEYKGRLSVAFQVAPIHRDLFLKDARFYVTPYVGRYGWISLDVGGRVNWTEVRELVSESWRLAAAKGARRKTSRRKASK